MSTPETENVTIDYDYYDRLLELKTCVGIWARDKRRLEAEPTNHEVELALLQAEKTLIQALGELDESR